MSDKKINSIFTTMGASSHSTDGPREINDYYATDPKALTIWMDECNIKFNNLIWEPSCGEGHLAKVLTEKGYNVLATDLIDRGYGKGGIDFLTQTKITQFNGDIVTNPPYKHAADFVYKSLSLIPNGYHVVMFLKILFLESRQRKKLFKEYPPKYVYVSSSRLNCAKNGDFNTYKSSAVAYAWFWWEKGYKGDTIIKWFN